jgi:hypothetical protein
MATDKYLSVSALTKYLKYKFDSDEHLRMVFLKGEISNFKAHSTGHLYFSINNTPYYMWLDVDNINDLQLFAVSDNPQSSTTTNRYISIQIIKTQESTTEFPREISLSLPSAHNTVSLVDKDAYIRHSNPSSIRCEIRYGKDDSVFKLEEVVVDYIKSPQCVKLTQEQMDLTIDTSQIMEFPDYVCQEIINELVHLVMENGSDARLQTHIPVS